MFRIKCLIGIAFMALVAATPLLAADDFSEIDVLGALGLAHSVENSCIAVWVEVPDKMAISSIKWYNNDGTIAFPEILVQSGSPNRPVTLPEAIPVAENVMGQSSGWSEATFSRLVGSESGGVYVIFRIPDGIAASANGAGGGPAIGYTDAASGVPGWLSSNGLEWEPLHPDYGFAVRAVLVAESADVTLKSAGKAEGKEGSLDVESESPVPVSFPTTLHLAYPNPFNPQTTLKYSLREASQVDLAVFNVRGEMVKRLVSELREAGEYTVVWDGRDRGGAALASGVYFARFVAGEIAMTQRLVLIQ